MFTDAKHMSATVHRAAILGAGITIGFGERRPWWHYAADAVLGFAAVALPPIPRQHSSFTWATSNVVGSFTATNQRTAYQFVNTGATANSSGSFRVDDSAIGVNFSTGGVNFARRIDIGLALRVNVANAEGLAYWTIGKSNAAAYGLVATGNYIGIRVANQTLTGLVFCTAGTVTITPVSVSFAVAGVLPVWITSNNGSISWYANGTLVGSTLLGPTTNVFGTLFAEIQNGATAAAYNMNFISWSEGY
jgi:hypothetical protein